MDLMITYGEKEIMTPVYIKVDAADQLLLSEGVCSLLEIVTYHFQVEVWRGGCKSKSPGTSSIDRPLCVPTVQVPLVSSVKVLPHQRTLALLRPWGWSAQILPVC